MFPEREMRSLRIALFTDTFAPQMNGVAKTLARAQTALAARRHSVRVFTTALPEADETPEVRRFPSVPFWAYPELRLSAMHVQRALRELSAWRPTLIHAATPFGVGLTGRAVAQKLGVPLVTSYHTSLTQYARHYGLGALSTPGMAYLRWFHNSGKLTFVPTEAIAAELRGHGFRSLTLWARGVDAARFHPGYRDPDMRAEMGVHNDSVVVAYVGRIASEKGIEVAARAMRQVTERRPNVVFAIAGGGPDEARIRAVAPKGTWFAGRLSGDRLSAFYASADVFVFPSTTDTFGNVLLEAMASGVPVVAADVPQSREVVGAEAGLFAAPGDASAFADAIMCLVDDRLLLDGLRRAALQRARAQSWEAVFEQLVADYRTVVRERSGAVVWPASLGLPRTVSEAHMQL